VGEEKTTPPTTTNTQRPWHNRDRRNLLHTAADSAHQDCLSGSMASQTDLSCSHLSEHPHTHIRTYMLWCRQQFSPEAWNRLEDRSPSCRLRDGRHPCGRRRSYWTGQGTLCMGAGCCAKHPNCRTVECDGSNSSLLLLSIRSSPLSCQCWPGDRRHDAASSDSPWGPATLIVNVAQELDFSCPEWKWTLPSPGSLSRHGCLNGYDRPPARFTFPCHQWTGIDVHVRIAQSAITHCHNELDRRSLVVNHGET
jgi:hypothetical protein